VSSPFRKPYPYWHVTTIGRLPSILKYGLLSRSMAKEKGIKNYRRNFQSSWNEDYVSLVSNESSREATAPHIAILIDPNRVEIVRAEFEKSDTNRPVPGEVLVRDMIAPDKFLGVVIGEVGYSFRLEKKIKPRPLNYKKITDVIESVKFPYDLPIYFKGKKLKSV